ncbi:MAG: S8 family serine peptidase, partial [Chromatiales bacterium]|nr:S8 family serine peptidase [Chromatiales bacterium]
MNRTLVECLPFLAAVAASLFATAGQAAEVDEVLYERLQQEERIRVVASFAVDNLHEAAAAPRRMLRSGQMRIADKRAAILSGLPKGSFKLDKTSDGLTAMALEVNAEALEILNASPDVLRIGSDEGGIAHMGQSLPLIGADALHNIGYTGTGRRIAVLDSGIDTDHPDFSARIVDEYCYCRHTGGAGCCPNGTREQTGPGSAEDDDGHGTNVTGIVAAKTDGVAPASEIVAVKVLGTGGFYSAYDIALAMDWVAANHPEVDSVNMSLGTFTLFTGACDNDEAWTETLAQAVANLRANGTVVLVSAGNNGSSTSMGAPACIQDSLAVGAVYDSSGWTYYGSCSESAIQDKPTCFSNSNSQTDIFAPGANITSS